jgi:hypothetical protein
MQTLPYKLLEETIGIPIEIKFNEFNEIYTNTHQKIVIQIKEEDPDLWAFGLLFALALMSFTFAAPRCCVTNKGGNLCHNTPRL